MNEPQFPLYVVSKGRYQYRHTADHLEMMGLPYYIIVEEQEADAYRAVIETGKVLVLDKKYQAEYDTFDDLGDTKSKGPGAARNFAWDHSVDLGFERHWVMDDNIRGFHRLNKNRKIKCADGAPLKAMEDFVLRYENVAMAGPSYTMFAPRKSKIAPFIMNTRIYSCNLIRNDLPYRWRGRYNEDTDLSIRMLKDGWCTVQFNAFLQMKLPTQVVAGGNTDEFYAKEGTMNKSLMQVKMHPDISEMVWKFGRYHHKVDYSSFRNNRLVRVKGLKTDAGVNDYGMKLKTIDISE